MIATCKDFVSDGYNDPKEFMQRCLGGTSLLPSDTNKNPTCGLNAVTKQKYSASLILGAILKLGYSNRPACDLTSLLERFENIKQKDKESAGDYSNRFSSMISKLQSATSMMQQSSDMPNEGAWVRKLKKGTRPELRHKANDVLQSAMRIPLSKATFAQYTSAMLQAEVLLNELDDNEKANKSSANNPEPKDKDKEKDKDKTKQKTADPDYEAKKAAQDLHKTQPLPSTSRPIKSASTTWHTTLLVGEHARTA